MNVRTTVLPHRHQFAAARWTAAKRSISLIPACLRRELVRLTGKPFTIR
jgi:hypothetical protein